MPELLLHYIWQSKAFMLFPQTTTDGRLVEVLDVGKHNMDAGPDFFNAKIRVGDTLWVGNVEIHINSSDWYKHHHDRDKAYDSVILHVVRKADKEVFSTDGKSIPQCELRYPDSEKQLLAFIHNRQEICAASLKSKPQLLTSNWKSELLVERLMKKVEVINQLLALTTNNWEQAFYITLAHNFGFHTNGLAFEMLAHETPLQFLRKHRDRLDQIEAMLFGQSGLLTKETAKTPYAQQLLREYDFLHHKFSLTPINGSLWKMARMRPQNFPHVRIAQFASLFCEKEFLSSAIMEAKSLKELREMFVVEASDYWCNHYTFAEPLDALPHEPKTLGRTAVDTLIINTVVPYMYAYGKMYHKLNLCEKAVALLYDLPAEKNHIVTDWKALGLSVESAADSQAFIQLSNNYCLDSRCMQCEVGMNIFTIRNENK